MCHKKFLHLLVLHFLPLFVTTNPGGGGTGFLQTVVAAAVCSVPVCDTVAAGSAGAGMVAAVGGALQTPSVVCINNCALLMILARIHPMPAPVPSGSYLFCATMLDTWLAYMCASSRGILGI